MEKKIELIRGQKDREVMLSMIDNLMRLDYAWQRAYQHYTTANNYYESIYNTMDPSQWEKRFILAVRKYLAGYHDTNLALIVPEKYAEAAALPDFEAHRYQDSLYVTSALKDSVCKAGDRITHLGTHTVMEYRELARFYLPKSDTDSYREDWSLALSSVSRIMIERDGEVFFVEPSLQAHADALLERTREAALKPVGGTLLTGNVLLLALSCLSTPEEAEHLLEQQRSSLSKAETVILDLRGNRSADDCAFLPLLPLVSPSDVEERSRLRLVAATYETFYTEHNSLRRIELMESAKRENPDLSEFLDACILETREKSGTGFQPETDDELSVPLPPPEALSARILVLADHTTEGAAERFVRLCGNSSRVVVAGRETRGSCDTFGLVTHPLGDGYGFVYPISITQDAYDDENALAGSGVSPEIEIGWTPGNRTGDRDLKTLLKTISQ